MILYYKFLVRIHNILKMNFYLSSSYLEGKDKFSLLLFRIFLFAPYLYKKDQLRDYSYYEIFIVMLLFNIFFNALSLKIGIVQRIADLF